MGAVVKWLLLGAGGLALLFVLALMTGAAVEWQAARKDAKKFPPPGRLVNVDGLKLHIDCRGAGAPTVVVDVGAGNWSTHWKHMQDKLATNGRVCLYDRPGFGWSDASPERRTGAGLTAQLHSLLEAAGEKPPFILIGHSFGGYIARFYYEFYPADVAGVVLVESGHEDQFREMPYLTQKIKNSGKQFETAAMMARFGLFRFVELPKTSSDVPDSTNQAMIDAARKTPKYWTAMSRILPAGVWIADELKGRGKLGDTPLLVISAARSAYAYCDFLKVDCERTEQDWDALQARLSSLSTDGAQIIHPMATHEINIDDPAFLVDRIDAFRQSVRN